jgi:hypothetical protein
VHFRSVPIFAVLQPLLHSRRGEIGRQVSDSAGNKHVPSRAPKADSSFEPQKSAYRLAASLQKLPY